MVAPITSSDSENQNEAELAALEDAEGAADLSAPLTPKQHIALDCWMKGFSTASIAKAADVHRGTVNRWMLKDANFIAARNARVQARMVGGFGKLVAIIPAALATIQDDIENGNSKLAMELLKLVMQMSKDNPLPLSATVIADQLKAAERQEKLALQQQQVVLVEQEEATRKRDAVAQEIREKRIHSEKPYLQRVEEDERALRMMLALSPYHGAQVQEVLNRVGVEVKRTVDQMMNPGVEKPATPAPSNDPNKVNPDAAGDSAR